MSVVAVALVLSALVALLLRTANLGAGSALVCILLGVVIGLTPAGPTVQGVLDASGAWVWGQVQTPVSRIMTPVGRTRAVGGTRRGESPVRLNVARVHIPLSAVLAAWLARTLSRVIAWAFTRSFSAVLARPWLLAVPVALVVLVKVSGGHPVPVLAGLVALAGLVLAGWWWRWRESFTRHVTWAVRGWWRGRMVYGFGWQPAMATTGLSVTLDGTEYLPRVVRVSSTGHVDRVTVRMLPGQVFDDWSAQGERLAQTFGAQDCRVRTSPGRHRLVLWFLTHDPLTTPITPAPTADDAAAAVDLAAVPVGLCEDGTPYRLKLLGTHVLVVGATGSGKGSVIWSTLHSLGPRIREGSVAVWCLDPKGGMELAPGRGLFARFVYGDPDDTPAGGGGGAAAYELEFASVLEDAVTAMRQRQATLRGRARLHTPTVGEPMIVVVIDEIASLTAYIIDRDAKRRIAAALGLLLSQGRAVGVSVLGAVQDPRKEVLTVRDLFPTRVALRLTEADHVGLVLGQGARDRGARCDQIPESLPGVGYVGLDGVAEPVRVRFAHITDQDIAALCLRCAPRPRIAVTTGDDRPVAA